MADKFYIAHPVHRHIKQHHSDDVLIEEAQELAKAIHVEVMGAEKINCTQVKPGSYLGSGTIQRLADLVKKMAIDVFFLNGTLSPIQQRHLEQQLHCKVIDRTALILEIFGERAKTKEGKLQVELAALTYQRSRLVRSWTHLERQRGGAGFMGGPGERQIETDRRLLQDRMSVLKKDLLQVTRTRSLHRKSRNKVPYPIVALVGYTNAGKSTLFNQLTHEDTFASRMLFATLDPKIRLMTLPSGREVLLSDTVGFISNLPTELIASFRATLEEVTQADLILHVRDISTKESHGQKIDVNNVLQDLGIDPKCDHLIEICNKIDACPNKEELLTRAKASARKIAISALEGTHIDYLLTHIDELLAKQDITVDYQCDITEGKLLAWIYEHAQVLSRTDDEQHITLRFLIDKSHYGQFLQHSKSHS